MHIVDQIVIDAISVTIPEPASCVLAGIGLLGTAVLAWRRRLKQASY
jgi:hypothetical protein